MDANKSKARNCLFYLRLCPVDLKNFMFSSYDDKITLGLQIPDIPNVKKPRLAVSGSADPRLLTQNAAILREHLQKVKQRPLRQLMRDKDTSPGIIKKLKLLYHRIQIIPINTKNQIDHSSPRN